MPMYEYACEKCGQIFEVMQKFSDAPLTECRSCGGPVKKLISQTAFALKGGGWYEQGYSGGAGAPACSSAGSGGGCAGCPKAANE
ncbi:zinc ribbon domain-containing protein [Desulfuromonas sp. KJ2020]|uniref:FmdB family zinc ribbon protein n=1 Tax=Desulfuromonas sp. KJ2020 TaxID=2919173 RepID=UPI0020A8232C|nr:zinc ribbon domain-containing protein [Desulfuromonas sp. KJ2020]MCP3176923.1 zinc ribbon domain-containing protein [Desulfuromonas sp. KJ2020]